MSLLFKEHQASTSAILASLAFIQTKSRILIWSYHVENTDGTDQPVHPPSLINIFVVHYEDSFVLIQAKCNNFIMIL